MPTLVVPGGPVVVVVVVSAQSVTTILVFIFFDIFCILLLKVVFFLRLKIIQKKNSTIFIPLFFLSSIEREKGYANDDMPKQRCFRAVVVLPFVACVVSALVFARPARGFYLPGVAPQGTSSLFLGLGSRRRPVFIIIFQRRAFVCDLSRI